MEKNLEFNHYVTEILPPYGRLDDIYVGKDKKWALTHLKMRQGPLVNSSRSFYQNIKDFFKKFFIFLKKSLMFSHNYFYV